MRSGMPKRPAQSGLRSGRWSGATLTRGHSPPITLRCSSNTWTRSSNGSQSALPSAEPHLEEERLVRVLEAVTSPHKTALLTHRLDHVVALAMLSNPAATLLHRRREALVPHVLAGETGL